MLLSIIIPVYNVENYLARCIDSILRQTFTDFELILIDDGSTDGSGAIADEYQLKDSRIKVVHQENGGQGFARNTGLNIARGEYIGFVDSDDWIDKEMYAKLMTVATAKKVDMVKCGFCTHDGENVLGEILFTHDVATEEPVYNILKSGNRMLWTVIWNAIYDKKLFDNLRFPTECHFEDAYVSFFALNYAKTCAVVNEALYYYFTLNPNSVTKQGAGQEEHTEWHSIFVLERIINDIESKHITVPEDIFAFQKQKWATDYYHYIGRYGVDTIPKSTVAKLRQLLPLNRRLKLLLWLKTKGIILTE